MIFRFLPKLIYAIGACLYLFTFGLFKAKNRFFIYKICTEFGWERTRRREILPIMPVEEALVGPTSVTIYNPEPKAGNVSLLELTILIELARSRNVKQVFEIGTFDGRTARNLAAVLPEDGKVYTLDLPAEMVEETKFSLARGEELLVKKPQSGSRFIGTPEAGKIEQLLGDSGAFDFGPYAGKMDLVFIDGSHAYDYVQSDSMKALAMLKPEGGLIFWHDYCQDWPDVTHALNHLAEREPRLSKMRHIAGTALAIVEIGPRPR